MICSAPWELKLFQFLVFFSFLLKLEVILLCVWELSMSFCLDNRKNIRNEMNTSDLLRVPHTHILPHSNSTLWTVEVLANKVEVRQFYLCYFSSIVRHRVKRKYFLFPSILFIFCKIFVYMYPFGMKSLQLSVVAYSWKFIILTLKLIESRIRTPDRYWGIEKRCIRWIKFDLFLARQRIK